MHESVPTQNSPLDGPGLEEPTLGDPHEALRLAREEAAGAEREAERSTTSSGRGGSRPAARELAAEQSAPGTPTRSAPPAGAPSDADAAGSEEVPPGTEA